LFETLPETIPASSEERKMHVPSPIIKRLAVGMSALLLLALSGSAASAQDASPAGASAGPPITLQFWQPDTRQDWLDAVGLVVKDFQAVHPNVNVEFTTTDWAQLVPKLTAAEAAGTVPDLYYFDTPVPVYGTASSGLLTPLTDVISSVGADKWPQAMLDADTVNGEVYGFPLYTYPQVLWYRKDLLEKAGIAAPTSMADVLAAAQKLNDPANKFYGTALYNDQDDPQIVAEVCASFGCSLFDKDGNVTINSPETIAALAYLKELWATASPDAISKADLDARLVFSTGGAAFDFTSVSFSNELAKPDATVKLDQVAAIQIPNDAKKVPATPAAFASITIPAGAPNADMAKEFLKFWAQQDEMVKFAENTVIGHIGVMTSVSDPASAYWTSPRIAPLAPFMKAGIEGASADGFVVGGYPKINTCGPQVLAAGIYTDAVSHLVVDSWTPEQTAKWMEDQVKQVCGL
jgi:multiple sugar transport system substrate-binding protein